MKNNPKTEKKLRNYRVIFQDGSEVEFEATGLKEAENVVLDMKKDPNELIELHSSPKVLPEGPEGEQYEGIPAYSKEDLDQMMGIHIDLVGDFIRVQHKMLTPHLSDEQKEFVENTFHALEEEASEENASVCVHDLYIVENKETVSVIEFTKTARVDSVTDITSFLAIAKAVIKGTEKMLMSYEIKRTISDLTKAICSQDPNSFPRDDE